MRSPEPENHAQSFVKTLLPLRTLPRRALRYARVYGRLLGPTGYRRGNFDGKVGFMVAGAMRCGTSTLCAYLKLNPEICWGDRGERKELHFFDHERLFRGKPNYLLYHARFQPQPSHKLLAEGTPYLHWRAAAERMHDYNPDLKTVVILRNPVDRAYSHWNMNRNRGRENLAFWEALQAEGERLATSGPEAHERYGYVDVGRYSEHLQRLWRYFPREQTLLLRTESLDEQPQQVVRQVCEFIGVADHPFETEIRRHVGRYDSPMTAEERSYLIEVFEPEVIGLEQLVGLDCRHWLT